MDCGVQLICILTSVSERGRGEGAVNRCVDGEWGARRREELRGSGMIMRGW